MAFHHVAVPTRDLEATHRFYTDAMGFELVKAVAAPTEHAGGWSKHLFYDTGGDGMIAFWDLHDPEMGDDWRTALSEGLGLPAWVAHLAFRATDLDDLAVRRERWLDRGISCIEVDHGFCTSIYTSDPNGTMVEWCADTAPYTTADRDAARALLDDPAPRLTDPPTPVIHRGRRPAPVAGG